VNCPKCKSAVTHPGEYCVACGFRFGKEVSERLSFYFDLKQEFEQFRSFQSDLRDGIEKVAGKIQTYEALIGRDLDTMAASLADEKKTGKAEPAGEFSSVDSVIPAAPQQSPRPEPGGGSPGFPAKTPRKEKQGTSDLEIQVGQKWLLIAGLLTMVFGVGYFLKYSFDQGWVGPAGRVSMAYVWGILFLLAGNLFQKKNFRSFGLSLVGGGIAVLYFATFAAFQLYGLLNQTVSFTVMILITVLASLLSILFDVKWLAVLGLIGGFLTPALLSTGQDNQIALMSYMTILNLGLLSIAFYKKWDLLNILGFLFTYLLFTGWFVRHYGESKFWPAIVFLTIFFLIYSVTPFAYQLIRKSSEKLRGAVIMVPNAFIAFGFSYGMIADRFTSAWVSVITLFYALVFLSLATYLYRREAHRQEAFVLLLTQATLFLVITVPLLFSQHWITIFWAVQALILLWMGIKLARKGLVVGAYVLLAIVCYKFLFYDYNAVFHINLSYRIAVRGSYDYLLLERFVTTFVLLVVLYLSGTMTRASALRTFSPERNDSAVIFTVLGIAMFIVFNIEASAFFYAHLRPARFAAISVLWTVFSVGLMIIGFRKNIATVRKVSIALFGVTILKVFLFDMAKFSTPYRIISFIILGLVLVGTSYLYHLFKDRILNIMAKEGTGEIRS